METGLPIREDNQKKKIEENFAALNNMLAGGGFNNDFNG